MDCTKWIYKDEVNYVLIKQKQITQGVTVLNNISLASDHRMVQRKIEIPGKPDRRKYFKKHRNKIDKKDQDRTALLNTIPKSNKQQTQPSSTM